MKARLVRTNGELHLLLCNGKLKKLSDKETREFLLTYDYLEHYAGEDTWNYPISMAEYDGETLAIVNDDNELVIKSADFLRAAVSYVRSKVITSLEYAEKHDRPRSLILRLCREDRLAGAYRSGTTWLIPEDTPYPEDARIGKKR